MSRADEMQTLTVRLGERSYPLYIGKGTLARAGEFLHKAGSGKKVAVITNPTVAKLYLQPVQEAAKKAGFEVTPVIIPDGEEHKELNSLASVYDRLIGARLERNSCVMALGGGVVGDLAGFAAATYLRGVPYVQVPTTLLAQVDSSVGGKTGINHHDGKNLIGAFYQPRFVLIDVSVLQSLPRRELVAGMAEVIKYGIIEDPELFGLLEQKMEALIGSDRDLLIRIVASSCAIKARVVEMDEREDDYRAVLNFGHTVGHALEAATGYRRYLHGEAVAIGMAKAASLSARLGFCDQASLARIRRLIESTGLPLAIPPQVSPRDLVQGMEVDKKAAGGKIKFVICEGIGKTRFHWLTPEEILEALSA
jgi:3-dehydroquinate synthase